MHKNSRDKQYRVFSGFRIGVRNDDYRVPQLTLILYDFIIVFSSNQTADDRKLTTHPNLSKRRELDKKSCFIIKNTTANNDFTYFLFTLHLSYN